MTTNQRNNPMNKKILLIDDEETLLQMVSEILTADGFFVETAKDGEIGLKMLLESQYDLIICDINMPKMNGIDVIKNAREKGNKDKFIFFTGHGNAKLKVESLKYGAYDFINKPQFSNLKEKIMNAFDMKN